MNHHYVVLSLIVVLFTTTGCFDGTTEPEPGKTPDLGSPAKTLNTVETAINEGNIELLSLCLSDDFHFYFNSDDIGDTVDGYEIPASWNNNEFIQAFGNVFDNAYSVTVTIGYDDVGEPNETDVEFSADNVLLYFVVFIGETDAYLAEGFINLKFIKDTAGDNVEWLISDWYDETTTVTTFGYVLAYFY